MVTVNGLRRYLNDRGCIEVRELWVAGQDRQVIEFECQMKSGKVCRALLSVDGEAMEVGAVVMTRIGGALAACLGEGWQTRIPSEDPFG